jgi:osmotically-inducible protein OsmY
VHDDNPAAKTANDIRAAARDMLQMGSRWAHSALDWFDERRDEMSNRTRDERDYGSRNRGASSPYSATGQGDWQERDRQDRLERQERQERQYGGRREQLQGRSDRDIQGDYSGGGYDQVGERDSAREFGERDYTPRRTYGYGREGYSQTQSPDDDSRRGLYGSDLGYGSSGGPGAGSRSEGSSYGGYGGAYGYGASGPGGVGYGAPGYGAGSGYGEPRYHGDFQSRGIGEEGYGSYRQDIGGSFGQGAEFGRDYGQSGGYAGRRGVEGQSWRSQDERGYSTYGRGLQGQGYGGQSYGERGYAYGQPDLGQRGTRDYRPQAYGQGAQGDLQGTQSGQLGRSYRGIGPRNYTRSDERIREDLNERLTDAHDIDASMITVEVSNGVATLTGTVNERWMKHRAEDIADGCTGVRDVRNNIQVQSSTQSESGSRYASETQSGSGSQTSYGSTSGASSQQGASSQSGSSASGSQQGGSLGSKSDTGTTAGSRGSSTGPNV